MPLSRPSAGLHAATRWLSPHNSRIMQRHQRPRYLTAIHALAGDAGSGGCNGDVGGNIRCSHEQGSINGGKGLEPPAMLSGVMLPVVVPVVLGEHEDSPQGPTPGAAAGRGTLGLGPAQERPKRGPREAQERRASGTQLCARWPALLLLPAAVWGLTWASTVGLVSAGYAALSSAAAIAAATFSNLAPGAVAAAPAAAAAAAVAAVDWVDVALRTTEGLTADDGGAGRAQVLAALQEAGAGRMASWAVLVLMPGLCGLAHGCRSAATAMGTGLPWLEPVAQLAAAAAGLGVLLTLAMPLRPYLAPLLSVLPRARPLRATWTALRASGAACMVAVLTALQAQELAAPPLVPSVRGAAAAAALSSPLLLQTQAALYGAAAVLGDAILPACTAVVAARAAYALLGQGRPSVGQAGSTQKAGVPPDADTEAGPVTAASSTREDAGSGGAVGSYATAGPGPAATFGAVRALAAGRLLLELLLLLTVAAGALPGKISAVRLLGMLWLLQTATQI